MADVEFEEFIHYFDDLPLNNRASSKNYTLVHDVLYDEDSSEIIERHRNQSNKEWYRKGQESWFDRKQNQNDEKPDEKKRLRQESNFGEAGKCIVEKLAFPSSTNAYNDSISINDEMKAVLGHDISVSDDSQDTKIGDDDDCVPFKPTVSAIASYLHRINVYSPDSEFCDSGNSTAHSPDDSFIANSNDFGFGAVHSGSFVHLSLLEATHRALHKFIPRHSDELELDIGDPIYVQKEAEDLWCEGINLRNGFRGIFPSAYIVDVEYNDFDPSAPSVKRERFLLTYLGSVETLYHKGNSVLCQAVHKIMLNSRQCHLTVLEVSDNGLKMSDAKKPDTDEDDKLRLDYFYPLKNVSFCGFYPQNSCFMGFITKHPRCDRFACHVFRSDTCTRPIIESIGRAFKRFYKKYIETAYPIEDIYIE